MHVSRDVLVRFEPSVLDWIRYTWQDNSSVTDVAIVQLAAHVYLEPFGHLGELPFTCLHELPDQD